MIRHAAPSAAIAALLIAGMAQANTVEVYFVDPLDNLQNGDCDDISGGQGAQADPSAGLQGHTCNSPSGEIFVDQGFGPYRFADGIFYMPEVDACMHAPSTQPGTALELVSCDGSEAQSFTFSGAGTITPAAAPQVCVTLGADTRFGRSEENQIKAMTLEPCSNGLAAFQIWSNRSAE
ncbi:RICIN domain-containing protein [Salipiger sp. 1_MG-2023]|uniref:ricin-type beta-trefoil lectin domain protein n=1 Tax=Salipiger sp. 1_MG-2023 TaxID=3062665 RepID=UPI0026E1D89B|nr:RICIN domain-containing protein [Salipiger sp. 1_MG-2023]MDO6585738.1 RICIN domain-containing protein [Salipiger sp. 1_MG-2023]